MAANNAPRYTGMSDFQGSITVTAANTSKDLTSGTINLLYTAPTDGALVTGVLAMPLGTNVATVARLFLNNGGATGTADNQVMVHQVSLPATTNSETAALLPVWIPIPRQFQDIKATHRLYVLLGTTVTAGWEFAAAASKF
ncbi:MAG: hypothetical protein ACRCZI_12190, partial [Cetobacterium sp.]